MRPNPVIVRAYTLRGARLWLGTRAIVSLLIVSAGAHPLSQSAAAIFYVVLLSVAVCFIDTWRHDERALLGNLGVSAPVLACLYALPAILGEAFVLAAGRLFA